MAETVGTSGKGRPAEPPKRVGQEPSSAIRIVGVTKTPLRDFYHAYLRLPLWGALLVIVGVYLALNALFAVAYMIAGGIESARPGSFSDAFFFSIQTMGTIGYGAMHPVSRAANLLVVTESVTGLIVTAVATGLLFSKFSQSNARIVFTRHVTITPMNGVPTLMLRVGNERSNKIMEAVVRAVLMRTERTKEGTVFYRLHDLKLVRDRSPAMARSWTVMHTIDDASPLFGQSPESIRTDEVELLFTVVGVDDTSLQPVHAQKTYADHEILWGSRHVDILREDATGQLTLDLRRFHDVALTEPTADFPYPKA